MRDRSFAREDVARATVLADFAARASENARLLDEAQVREAERARLSEQLVSAEQDERRRLALFLHDGAGAVDGGHRAHARRGARESVSPEALPVMDKVLDQHRETIRELRDLSFNLEPVVLRDQGFGPAVQALAEQLGLEHAIQIDVDVAAAESLGEERQAALYQIIREAMSASIRRGPPSRMSVTVTERADGGLVAEIADDAPGERRRSTFARARGARSDAERDSSRSTSGRTSPGRPFACRCPPYATELEFAGESAP